MESEFIQSVKSYFTTEFKDQIALSLDEQSAAVSKALSAAIPAGLMSVIRHSSEGRDLFLSDMALSAANYFPKEPDLVMLNNEGAGSRIPEDLLNGHQATLRHSLAKYAGIKNESAGSLIMITMPVIMRNLGVYIKTNQWTNDDLAQFLRKESENVKSVTPDGFEPVVENIRNNQVHADKEVTASVETDSPKRTNKGWILPIVLVILAVLFLVYLSTR